MLHGTQLHLAKRHSVIFTYFPCSVIAMDKIACTHLERQFLYGTVLALSLSKLSYFTELRKFSSLHQSSQNGTHEQKFSSAYQTILLLSKRLNIH